MAVCRVSHWEWTRDKVAMPVGPIWKQASQQIFWTATTNAMQLTAILSTCSADISLSPGSPESPCCALDTFLCLVTENWFVFRTWSHEDHMTQLGDRGVYSQSLRCSCRPWAQSLQSTGTSHHLCVCVCVCVCDTPRERHQFHFWQKTMCNTRPLPGPQTQASSP